MRVAAMGYPDIIAPLEMLAKIHDLEGLKYREDSLAICARHGLQNRQIPDAESFFKLCGCELDVYDIVQERGCEILCDLNEPLKVMKAYDLVLDVGTIEHCFNIAQAAFNMAGLVKLGGVIIHENPFNWGNHGLYNLNPTWYADFYGANGFKLLECKLATREGRSAIIPHTRRFRFLEEEVNVFAMARRMDIVPMTYPTQTKYKSAIPAAVDNRAKEVANG